MPRLRPLFIGLPGAGKTTLSRAVAQAMGMTVVSTDPLFRTFRAIPATRTTDPRSAVMRDFLNLAAVRYPNSVDALRTDATITDDKDRCALHDGKKFRTYGEDVFRLFECVMLAWLDRNGDFNDAILDLSASAPLYAENRTLFKPANGYLAILLDTPLDQIVTQLLIDYRRYRRYSAAAGEDMPMRGAYEQAFNAALAEQNIPDPNTPAAETILRAKAQTISAQEEQRRMATYRQFASYTLHPTADDTIESLVAQTLVWCTKASAA